MSVVFLDTLRNAGLEKFHKNFLGRGISTVDNLGDIALQNYADFGVTSMEDRRKLFMLIQKIKSNSIQRAPSVQDLRKQRYESSPGLYQNRFQFSGFESPRPRSAVMDRDHIPRRPSPLVSVPSERIRVCVRKRPLKDKEKSKGEQDIAMVMSRKRIVINEAKTKVDLTKFTEKHEFYFDEVMESSATNEEVYSRTAMPLVEYIFERGNATCFAYGQTGSGKTHTMLHTQHGLYVLAARDIFRTLMQKEYSNLSAWVSFYEIYQGQLYDLLNDRKKIYAREDGNSNVCITGIVEKQVRSVEHLLRIFDSGNVIRSTGKTGANSDSSRSHAILQLSLKKSNETKPYGKFSFIDLAGSERGADRGEADAKTRMEGSEINKSLLALKECIRSLDQDSKHTPFRQSKLTQVLKDSFIGNSKTCMIATISPNISNSEHTLNTLRYADRVKELKSEEKPIKENTNFDLFITKHREYISLVSELMKSQTKALAQFTLSGKKQTFLDDVDALLSREERMISLIREEIQNLINE